MAKRPRFRRSAVQARAGRLQVRGAFRRGLKTGAAPVRAKAPKTPKGAK